jgi:AmpD protein
MEFPEITRLSPNFSGAPPHEKFGVIFHHSVLSFNETIARMTEAATEVSDH